MGFRILNLVNAHIFRSCSISLYLNRHVQKVYKYNMRRKKQREISYWNDLHTFYNRNTVECGVLVAVFEYCPALDVGSQVIIRTYFMADSLLRWFVFLFSLLVVHSVNVYVNKRVNCHRELSASVNISYHTTMLNVEQKNVL